MTKLCICALALSSAIFAADPSVRSGTIEITGFGGLNAILPGADAQFSSQTLGISVSGLPVSQTHPALGGSVGMATGHHLMLLGEFMYSGLGKVQYSDRISTGVLNVEETSRLYEFTGGAQYLVRTESSRISPYIGCAFGAVRLYSKMDLSAASGVLAGITSVSGGETKATGNLSAGVRLHFSDSFGIRPEFRVVRLPGRTYVRAQAGVFYQFRK